MFRSYLHSAAKALKSVASVNTCSKLDSPYRESSVTIFACAFVYFLCSQFFWTSSFIYNLGFYCILLPSFIVACKRKPILLKPLPRNFGTLSLAAFFLYIMLHSLLWSYEEQSVIQTLGDTLWTASFMLMGMVALHCPLIDLRKTMHILVRVVAVCSFLSIIWFLYDGGMGGRLVPIGRAHGTIPATNAYAVVALIAAYLLYQHATQYNERIWAIFCIVGVTAIIILSQSRGPFFSFLLGYCVLVILMRQWLVLLWSGLLAILLFSDYIYTIAHGHSLLHLQFFYEAILDFFTKRDSYRLIIWRDAWDLIMLRPWQGYGMQAKHLFAGTPGAVNPHNLFLGTAYYTGFPGLILFLLPLCAAFFYALRRINHDEQKLYFVLLLHAAAAVFTDLGQPVKAPSAIWTIYWLPMLMELASTPVRIDQKLSVGQT